MEMATIPARFTPIRFLAFSWPDLPLLDLLLVLLVSADQTNSSAMVGTRLNCWCGWRWPSCFLSTPFLFLAYSFVILTLFASLFSWFAFSPLSRSALLPPYLGCRVDIEGYWSIFVFYGDSPFLLKPVESVSLLGATALVWFQVSVLLCACKKSFHYFCWFLVVVQMGFLISQSSWGCIRIWRSRRAHS